MGASGWARRGRVVGGTFVIGGVAIAACLPPPTGTLEIRSGSSVVFSSATGFAQSWFGTSLGTAEVLPLVSGSLSLSYSDTFSTLASQEEVLVMARDPLEYRATLESVGGPSSDPVDPGHFLEFKAETFGCGDTWPIVPTSDPVTNPPSGVTLPFAVSVPFPDQATPQIDWSLTKLMFVGSGASPCGNFAGTAASFEGSIKGVSVMRRGVCSRETVMQSGLSSLTSIPLHNMVFGLGLDIADLGFSSFVSYAPTGGFVVTAEVDASEIPPPPIPPVPVASSFERNYTYTFTLDDGIVSVDAPNVNISTDSGFDPLNAGGAISGLLGNVFPNREKLSALEGAPGSFTGGQAQPIPTTGTPTCTNTSGQRPASCFTPCRTTDTVDMNNPSTWPSPEDAGDPTHIDPASWHDMQFCAQPAALLGALLAGAGSPPTLAATISEALPLASGGVDSTKFHNWRCNFYPRYEAPTSTISVTKTDPLTSGAPFGIGAKNITTGPPACELIVRIKRINVFPDTVEAVFFDGTSLGTPDPSDALGNEGFAVFTALGALGGAGSSGIGQMCRRGAETPGTPLSCSGGVCAPLKRTFAHLMLH